MKIRIFCPRCSKEVVGYPATSRRDNITAICDSCGLAEALEDAKVKDPYEGVRYWML